jgi:cytochrome d ubiquinol oxidase subunit II
MDLATVWFLLIAFFWAGYLVLEGFDFGVGMLLPFAAENADERGQAIRTFGPVWDANEVWLIVAGASMFAAFPHWYAAMFSAMYLPLTLLLVALIVRVLAIEWRVKLDDERWKRRCDRVLVVSSYVAPLVIAIALANVVRGIPMDENSDFTGTVFDLFNPYAVTGGLAVLAIYALHGATFLGLRSTGAVRDRAQRIAIRIWPVATVLGGGVLLFAQLWPNVLPSTDVAAGTVSIANGSSSAYTLKVMTWVAATIIPVVLIYQGWSYWVFRHRIQADGFEKAKSPLQALEQRRAAED